MAYIKAVSDQPITRFDHVVVAVMGKFSLEPVGGLARATASNRIRHDDEVFRRIERLPGRKQLVGEARAQPIRAGASVALQEPFGPFWQFSSANNSVARDMRERCRGSVRSGTGTTRRWTWLP